MFKFKIGDKVRYSSIVFGQGELRVKHIISTIIDTDHYNREKYKLENYGWVYGINLELIDKKKKKEIKPFGIVKFMELINV